MARGIQIATSTRVFSKSQNENKKHCRIGARCMSERVAHDEMW